MSGHITHEFRIQGHFVGDDGEVEDCDPGDLRAQGWVVNRRVAGEWEWLGSYDTREDAEEAVAELRK